ncbi:lactoylglutathione lyase-like [Amphibalanus amphitrite]|uniref:lactoylglutathione lyase-like n=1 Tax=Amphibalanus amphitrite TaxID=1232801 RepID=UPI001C924906|nr:lactoylglutathione lyase-like [Amphibalanus amphitrite]
MSLTDEEIAAACSEPDPATAGTHLQHTMYRVKDAKVSLDFYTRVLGMRLLKRLHLQEAKVSLYLLGFEDAADIPSDPKERTRWCFGRRAVVELAHKWGTESDPKFTGYCSGNDPASNGYGHIALHVTDLKAACERFERLGVEFVVKPGTGLVKGIAFIKDPDGYWIEILTADGVAETFPEVD